MLQKTWIDWRTLSKALTDQPHQRDLLGEMLVRENRITELQVLRALAIQYGVDFVHLKRFPIESQAIQSVSKTLAERYQFLPVEIGQQYLVIAVTTPYNYFLKALLSQMTGKKEVRFICADPDEIKRMIHLYYDYPQAISL